MISLVVTDLDGTLWGEDEIVPEAHHDALNHSGISLMLTPDFYDYPLAGLASAELDGDWVRLSGPMERRCGPTVVGLPRMLLGEASMRPPVSQSLIPAGLQTGASCPPRW